MLGRCPNCGSDNTQRLQIIHEGGLKFQNASSVSGGAAGGAFGEAGVLLSTTRGTQQSVLSMRAAPPAQRRVGCVAWTLLIISIIMLFTGQPTAIVVGLIAGGFTIAYVVSQTRYNSKEWPPLFERWQQTFMCMRCGKPYIPSAAATDALTAIAQTASVPALGPSDATALPEASANPDKRFCHQCGAQIGSTSRFCASCGQRLDAP
jgi:hypothetical protein